MDLELFVINRGDRLVKFAYLQCANLQLAEDIVQSVLCDFVVRRQEVESVANLEAYSRRAIIYKRNSVLRRRLVAARTPHLMDKARMEETIDFETRMLLWHACLQLPWKQRAAVTLRYYEDFDYPTIAQVLECREATARSLVRRGLQTLKHSLSRIHQDGQETL